MKVDHEDCSLLILLMKRKKSNLINLTERTASREMAAEASRL